MIESNKLTKSLKRKIIPLLKKFKYKVQLPVISSFYYFLIGKKDFLDEIIFERNDFNSRRGFKVNIRLHFCNF